MTAVDKATGRSQDITITASSGLSEAEVESMRKTAEEHADEDIKKKELIEARNAADNSAYAAEKALRDLGDKVPADVKTKVEDQVAKVREVLDSGDVETLTRETEALNQVIQEIGASAYQQEEPQAQAPEADGGDESQTGSEEEDVVDGEYRDV